MARRGENIYKRKDGRYEGRYIKGRKPGGKPLFGYVYRYSYAEVKRALTLAKSVVCDRRGLTVIGDGTVRDFLSFWLERMVKSTVKHSTFAQYHDRIYTHILPELGNIAIRSFSAEQARRFVESLCSKGLSPSTVRNIAGLLRFSMKKAVEMQLLPANPCEKLAFPQAAARERRALSRSQQIMLEKALTSCETSCETGVLLALYTGLRIGEICALRWQDVDLKTDALTVRGTLQRVKTLEKSGARTEISLGPPKSKDSSRTIPLPCAIAEKLRQLERSANGDFVITGSNTPLEPRTLRAKYSRIAAKCGLFAPFHALRHTFATRCLEHSFDIQTVSELLGHSSASVTMKVYAHSLIEHKRMLTRRIHLLSEMDRPSNKPSEAAPA